MRRIFKRIKIDHGVTKRGVIMLWSVAVSIVLYFLSLPISSEQGNLFFKMVSFAAVLFGGGAAYHMVTLMIECPQNTKNYEGWMSLLLLLVKVYIGFTFAVTCLGIGAYVKGAIGVGIITVGYLLGFMWASNRLIESHKLVMSLKANV